MTAPADIRALAEAALEDDLPEVRAHLRLLRPRGRAEAGDIVITQHRVGHYAGMYDARRDRVISYLSSFLDAALHAISTQSLRAGLDRFEDNIEANEIIIAELKRLHRRAPSWNRSAEEEARRRAWLRGE